MEITQGGSKNKVAIQIQFQYYSKLPVADVAAFSLVWSLVEEMFCEEGRYRIMQRGKAGVVKYQ